MAAKHLFCRAFHVIHTDVYYVLPFSLAAVTGEWGRARRCRTRWTRGAVGDEYLSMEGVLVVLGCPGPGVGLPLVRVGNTTQRRDKDGAFVINYNGVGGRDTHLFVYSSGRL